MSVKKRILEVTIFLLVMFLTFYTLFSGKNLGEIANAVSKMSVGYLVPAAALAIFFVCAEGYMIWYLLQAMKANRRKEGSSLIGVSNTLLSDFSILALRRLQQEDSLCSSII